MGLFDYLIKGAEIGMSLLATAEQAETTGQASDYNARMAEENARRSRIEAQYIRRQTEIKIDTIRRNAALKTGEQTAAYGASGVSVSSGSAVDVLKDTAMQAAADVEIIRSEGKFEQAMAEMKASDYESQADVERWYGGRARTASTIKAGTSILKGASDIYDLVTMK